MTMEAKPAQPAVAQDNPPAVAPRPHEAAIRPQDTVRPEVVARRPLALTTWEGFWYVLQCIAFAAGYFAKVPVKKALSEVGPTQLTGAEKFWYVLMCIAFGAGYFAKVPIKKALSEAASITVVRH